MSLSLRQTWRKRMTKRGRLKAVAFAAIAARVEWESR